MIQQNEHSFPCPEQREGGLSDNGAVGRTPLSLALDMNREQSTLSAVCARHTDNMGKRQKEGRGRPTCPLPWPSIGSPWPNDRRLLPRTYLERSCYGPLKSMDKILRNTNATWVCHHHTRECGRAGGCLLLFPHPIASLQAFLLDTSHRIASPGATINTNLGQAARS